MERLWLVPLQLGNVLASTCRVMNWSTSLTAYVPKKVIEPSGTALVSSGVCWLQTRESQDGDHQRETSVVIEHEGASGIGAERIGRPADLMSRLSDERPGTDDTFRLGEDWHSKANCPSLRA